MLQLLHRSFRPKLGQRRILDEAFVQQEITVRESFLQSLEPCVSRIAFCHCVLPRLPRKAEKLTFCQEAVFPVAMSHCQVVVKPHLELPVSYRHQTGEHLLCRNSVAVRNRLHRQYLSLVWRSVFRATTVNIFFAKQRGRVHDPAGSRPGHRRLPGPGLTITSSSCLLANFAKLMNRMVFTVLFAGT